jgi:hypothetical protein
MNLLKPIVAVVLAMTAVKATAAPLNAPPSFKVGQAGKAIFVDFLKADYQVVFDVANTETKITSLIQFQNDEIGMPVFDLIDNPDAVVLDGETVTSMLMETPHQARNPEFSQIRVIQSIVQPGAHQLVVRHTLKTFPAKYQDGGVESGFFMSDFDSRGLLERYLPANFEFDQLAMTLKVSVVGGSQQESLFTNGNIQTQSDSQWTIEFPSYFNCSALYFHIRPKAETSEVKYTLNSIDGREIPVAIYTPTGPGSNLQPFKKILDETFLSDEKLLGPFPHQSITVYISGLIGAGMEYAGAMTTDFDSLPHEFTHSYFGRGVMPANGNAGWIDEAMTSLVSGPQFPVPDDIKPKNMANHSAYYRANDTFGYYEGQNFLNYIGKLFSEKSPNLSLNLFLKNWIAQRHQQVITTEILRAEMEKYSGLDLNDTFQKYVY